MKKSVGYLLVLLGIVLLALAIPPVQERFSTPLITSNISNIYLTGAGLVLIILGIIFIKRGGYGSSKGVDLPIYQGKKVVGYRRR